MLKPLRTQDPCTQAKIAVALLLVIPSLAFFYLGFQVGTGEDGLRLYLEAFLVAVCVLASVLYGYRIFRIYPQTIRNLRHFIAQASEKTFWKDIPIQEAQYSDELKTLELGLNKVMKELTEGVILIEEKYRLENILRKHLEHQHRLMVQSERHLAMVQSIGAACHHLGQPTAALRMRLYILKEKSKTLEEMAEIDQCLRDLDEICDILHRLREVREFRTEPYLGNGDAPEQQILAI